MADKTVVVRAVYRSNVAQGMRSDAGAITGLSASVESAAAKSVNSIKTLGAASAVAGKLLLFGIGGAMAVGAKAAIDFESSMAGVAKTTDLAGNSFDRNSGPLFAFGQALRQMSLRVPINVNELAKIAELGGQLGVQTPNLMEFTEVMAELGVATNMTAEEAATGFARFANIMRTPQDEFRRLGDVIVELGNNLATTESEILTFGIRIAPVGLTVGATEEQVFGLAGALSSLGIPAERGGTAVQKWMIQAKEAVDSGGESLDRFAKVAGLTSDEFAKLFRESPAEAFAVFVKGLDGISKSGGNVFATLDKLSMSEVRLTQVLLAAAGGYETVAESIDMANDASEEATALEEEAARRFGTTASQIQLVGNAFNDLRIEIGNAVLGSGGLAFALDVAKEFFGIIKDNLGVLEMFAFIAGGLVTLCLGVFFFQAAQNAQNAITQFRGLTTATATLSGTAKIAQGGMLLLTGAMQGALGVAGLLAAAWAIMAVNAAQAKAEARLLREEIENGADPLDLFSREISEALNENQLRLLHELGFGVKDLAQFLMDGRPAASELGQALEEAMTLPGGDTRSLTPELRDAVIQAQNLNGVINDAGKSVDNFFKVRSDDLRNSLIESGKAASLTVDQMDNLAKRAIGDLGFDITDDEFIAYVEYFTGQVPRLGTIAEDSFGKVQDALGETDQSWQDFLTNMFPDDAESMMEDFTDANIDAVGEFVDQMQEEFDRVGEVVRSGFPVWEEYEKVVLGATEDGPISFRKALEAQQLFLEDTRDFIERLPDMMDMGASPATIEWLESLDAPIRGAIGRLNDSQLEELIAGANRNFDELHALHLMRWMQIYPGNANLAFGAMVGELAARVGEMNLPGELAGEAFMDGLMEMMMTMPEENRDEFLGFLTDLLSNDQWLEDNGFSSGDKWIIGLLDALAGLAGRVKPTIEDQAQKIKGTWNDEFEVFSPSKWFQGLGEKMVAGLELGLQSFNPDNLIPFDPNRLMPGMTPGMGSMSQITNNRNANYSLTVNGGGNSTNLRAEAQTLLTLLTIVGGVEHGAGR